MKREVAAFRSKLMNIYRTHIEMINDLPAFREEEAQPEQEEQNMPATPAEEPAVAGVQPEEAPMQMAMDEAAAAQAFETSAGDDGPAAGESNRPDEGAPDVKLNVRFDEESGEYLPMADNGRRHR
jgi:cell division initiation protein